MDEKKPCFRIPTYKYTRKRARLLCHVAPPFFGMQRPLRYMDILMCVLSMVVHFRGQNLACVKTKLRSFVCYICLLDKRTVFFSADDALARENAENAGRCDMHMYELSALCGALYSDSDECSDKRDRVFFGPIFWQFAGLFY